ncbi:MAG TPA: MFS transporter [Jatrophihabitantaceae bacterium]|jgi:MFS family permease|nr:MFS transporter [Jatrophihabitantaceae bacterium]
MPDRRLLADLRPLRKSAAYRRLWFGTTFSSLGSAMTNFAVILQVYLRTHSSAAVGGVGLAIAVPSITFGLFGGTIVDAVDRRRLVLITQTCMMAVSVGLAAQAFAGGRVLWLLYALVAVEALFASINAPARRTFMPRLLPKDQIPAGAALTMLTMHTSVLVGPLLAGLIVPVGGLKACYAIDAVSFLAALYGVFRLPPMRPEGEPLRPGLRAVVDGLRFLGQSRVLTGVLLADMSATLLAMPIALFPAINAERFGGSPRTLGLLNAGLAIGGLLATVFSGPVGRIRRPGLGVLVCGGIWGAALAAFGVVDGLFATMAFLIIAGVADVTSVVLRSTIIQLASPDNYRGRINAAEIIVGGSVPQLGNFRSGAVAQASTTTISAASGGLAAIGGAALVALAFPALVRYRVRSEINEAQPAHQ